MLGEESFDTFRVQEKILEILEEAEQPMRMKHIVADVLSEVDINRRTVERAIETLVNAGKVSNVKFGYYALADQEETTTTPTLL